jgi:hypothetical protein
MADDTTTHPDSFKFLAAMHPRLPWVVMFATLSSDDSGPPEKEVMDLLDVEQLEAEQILSTWKDLYLKEPCACQFLVATARTEPVLDDSHALVRRRHEELQEAKAGLRAWYVESPDRVRELQALEALLALPEAQPFRDILDGALVDAPQLQRVLHAEDRVRTALLLYSAVVKAPLCVRRSDAMERAMRAHAPRS